MHFLPTLFLLLPCLLVPSSPPLFAAASSLDSQNAVHHAAGGECSCTPVAKKGVALDTGLASLAPRSFSCSAEKRVEEVDKPETTLVQGGYPRLGRGDGSETEKLRYVFIENAASPPPGLGMHVWIEWVGVICCYLVIFGWSGRWLG